MSNEATNPTSCPTPVISSFSIAETLEMIKEQAGLDLDLCDYFTGIKEHNGRKHFNVILSQRTSESKEYDILKKSFTQQLVIGLKMKEKNEQK